jgi:hypothetical protein
MDQEITISKPLAPEDISPGDYVTVLHVVCEYLNIFSDCAFGQPPRPFRVAWLPPDVTPLKVVSICLPFVLVEDAKGASRTMDLRRHTLARLDEDFARKAMKRTRKASDPAATKSGDG